MSQKSPLDSRPRGWQQHRLLAVGRFVKRSSVTGVALVAALLYLQCSNEGETDDRRQRPFYPQPIVSKHATSRGSGFVSKIERPYRSSVVDREVAAKLIGYSGSTGPANAALAALATYGLVERAGKGQLRVTPRARAILHASDERERTENLLAAAYEPDLFREIRDRFEGIAVPPEEGVITYLNRQGFNPTAVRPAAKAFLQTMVYVEELRGSESHRNGASDRAESSPLSDEGEHPKAFGGAKVGDQSNGSCKARFNFHNPCGSGSSQTTVSGLPWRVAKQAFP